MAEIIDVKIKKRDIEACHRLNNRSDKGEIPKRSIVRFVNRKFCDKLHRAKCNLKKLDVREKLKEIGIHQPVYINNNLCPCNKFLWGKCKKLFEEKLVDRFWIYNGSIYISNSTDPINSKTKIDHIDVLKRIFPGYDFDTKF